MSDLRKVPGHRMWFIESFMVWGQAGLGEMEYLVIEKLDAISTVYLNKTDIGDSAQTVNFADLVDHRGNNLPSELASPRVVVRNCNESTAYVLGTESGASFKIVRGSDSPAPVMVDLLIVEMGA